MGLIWFNGTEYHSQDAWLRVDDLGLQRGYSAFEFMRAEGPRLFHAHQHIRRLENSARLLAISLEYSTDELVGICQSLADRTQNENCAIRILATGGYSDLPAESRSSNVIITTERLPIVPAEQYHSGIALISVEFQRELPQAKSTNYMHCWRMQSTLRERGADDMLYWSDVGVTECPRSNVFAVIDDTLVTPSEQILSGVTRSNVLKLAEDAGIPVSERRVSPDELQDATELFVTSTTKRILPVTRFDDRPVGTGQPGSVTRDLARAFHDYINRGEW